MSMDSVQELPASTLSVGAISAVDRHRVRSGKTAMTNGSKLLSGVDGRQLWARRCRELLHEHLSDMPDASAAERSIVRRAAVLSVELERMERTFALTSDDKPPSADAIDLYQRTANSLRRLLEAVGLQRGSRDVTPDPLDYAREHAS
jgi:hypothetical protein